MPANKTKLRSSGLSRFYKANEDFDLLTFDFFDPASRGSLGGDRAEIAASLEALRPYQRLYRLFPADRLSLQGDGAGDGLSAEAVATGLIERGYDSAQRIASVSPLRFERECLDLFDGDASLTQEVRRRAGQASAIVRHAFANVRALTASPHDRNSAVRYAEPEVAEYFQALPSYQSLFGSLDYIEVPHDASIFGPAAYLLDIMRITDEYITYYNEATIPPGYQLKERRRDLFDEIKLDAATTTATLPYVSLIVGIFEKRVALAVGGDPYQALAVAPYPFGLPFNRPWMETSLALIRAGTSLEAVGRAMRAPDPYSLGYARPDLAAAALGISPEQVAELVTVNGGDAAVGAQYGLGAATAALPKAGAGQIAFTKSTMVAHGVGVDLKTVLVPGQRLETEGQIRTVVAVSAEGVISLDVPWATGSAGAAYDVYGFPIDLSNAGTFRAVAAGDMTFQALQDLLTQQLSPEEQTAKEGNAFFINATGEGLDPLAQIQGDALLGNVVTTLVPLSLKRLDRLSRFIRMLRWSGADPAAADWLLRLSGADEITANFLSLLAATQKLAARLNLDLATASAMVGLFKTQGKGDARTPTDPFDLVFNNVALLKGADPYSAPDPIPFDPARPLSWAPRGLAVPGVAGTLQAATASTATLAAAAPATDGTFDGFQIAIANGPGAGQSRVIRSYAGGTRVATLYENWTTAPDATSHYAITNAADLSDRLAAAVSTRQTELSALGDYYKDANAPDAPALRLDLETLTGLWRLGRMASANALSTSEYLVARRLAGLNGSYDSAPAAALADAETAIETIDWLRARDMSAYELDYIVNGTQSRYVRPRFTREQTGGILQSLAALSANLRLTAATLQAAGFPANAAGEIVAALQTLGVVNSAGLVLPNDTGFDAAAAAFPIDAQALQDLGLSPKEADAAIATLAGQRPPYLAAAGTGAWTLTASYPASAPLDFLFVGLPNASGDQANVGTCLDSVAADISFQIVSPTLPFAPKTGFKTASIGEPQSELVFNRLLAVEPAVLIHAGAGLAFLSAGYDGSTEGWDLFTSPASGQSAAVSAYVGAKREATLAAPWTKVPDAFAYYELVATIDAGSARGGGARQITLADSASDRDGDYVDDIVTVTAGAAAGEQRRITAYEGATRIATVAEDWGTAPDATSAYRVERTVAAGNVEKATATTVTLDARASNVDGAYDGAALRLVPDPEAESKTQQVSAILDTRRSDVTLLAQLIAQTQAAQCAAVTGACADVLATPSAQVLVAVAYLTGEPTTRLLVPTFLGGDTEANRAAAGDLLDGLSQFIFLRSKMPLPDTVWVGMAREPGLYGLDFSAPFKFANLTAEGALVKLARNNGASPDGVMAYLELWTSVVGEDAKLAALQTALGWQPADTRTVDAYLRASGTAPNQNPEILPGLVRLDPSFAIIGETASNGAFLVQVAGMIASPPLGPIGGSVDAALWARLNAVSSAALGVVAVRYGDPAFAGVADQLRRAGDVQKRDALMGFLIWTLNKTIPIISSPSDLFEYLLIDVEQSGCDTTSPIAQGIASVQLYMQRCRMALEPGVTVDHIPDVWWSWMSAYRLWEANRKIFLYPENYLNPTHRKSASPQFVQLESDLLQGRPSRTNVAKSLIGYFNAFEQLCELVPIGACKKEQSELEYGQIDETMLIVGRSNTSPYDYYVRELTRSIIPPSITGGAPQQVEDWRSWISIDVKVDAPYVTPVWAFERLFVFWNALSSTKSSTITTATGAAAGTSSSTQSTWTVTPRYTFRAATGDWLSPQAATDPNPNRIAPNSYAPASTAAVKAAYAPSEHYWEQPLALALPRGLPGTGQLSFTKGSSEATGTGTRLDGQLLAGDFITANGQRLQVQSINAGAQKLVLRTPFRTNGAKVPFNVIPKDSKRQRYTPFTGPGLANVVKNFDVVNGDPNTRFTVDFMVGDYIEVEGEVRAINAIFGDDTMTTTRTWSTTTANPGKPYRIIPREDGAEKLVVVFGPNFDLDVSYGAVSPPGTANPTGDPFLSATIDFNSELYNGVNLLSVVKNDPTLPQQGDVTAYRSMILSPALDGRPVRIFSPFYAASLSQTSPLIRPAIDRENQLLFVRTSTRPLVSLYWGNSTPGTTANQQEYQSGDRVLLYHVNPDNSALIAVSNQIGWSVFNTDDDSFLVTVNNVAPVDVGAGVVLKTFSLTERSGSDGADPAPIVNKMISFGPYSFDNIAFESQTYQVARLNTGVAQALKRRLYAGIDQLLALDSQFLPETPFDQYYSTPAAGPPPTLDPERLPPPIMDFKGAYGPYFWEIFYHAPTLIADWLAINQDHELAKAWYEYVFDPMATADPLGATGNTKYWRFRPFRENMDLPSLQETLTNGFEINLYNNDPFDPHAIARLRISAYAKYTVLRYVENLISWADALFTQDSRESISQATNLYVLARDLLGRKPEVVGVFEQPAALTYDEIKALYPRGGIPQFLIDLENTPFAAGPSGGSGYADVPVNDIHAYFGVPDNAELTLLWETIDDRLFKIRHCMDINGVERSLALFAPAIDPAALIAGLGAGGTLGAGASGASYPVPNYRFAYLISVARSITDQVARLGAGLLNALERKDAEAMARLQLSNEAQLLSLGTQIKEKTIVQVQDQIDGLTEARAGAQARQTHFTALIDAGLLPTELAQEVTLGIAGGFQMASSVLGAAAAVSAAFPQVGSPFAMTYGGQQLGASLQNLAGWSAATATALQTASQILSIESAHSRRKEDWELQDTLAGFDIAQFDAQIAAAQVQLEVAQRDLQIHTTQIALNQVVQDFQKTKFTNESLYSWMAGKLATSYFQAYGLALEFSRMAQRAYQFEYRVGTSFIAASYWDDLHKGLTAGEQLGQALSQLEGAYIRSGARSQNITKTISLAALDPVAFLQFVATGDTQFDLPERIFDEDFPGQYKRRIVSMRVSLPALVGPYRNIHATLTQTASRVVLQPDLDAVKFLLGDNVEVAAGKIEHNVRVGQKFSLSKGQGDTGAFDPSPNDPLYMPFEQTGAVSSWRLTMPKPANPISFEAISDVILEIQYTAADGGTRFAEQVAALPQLRSRQWTVLIQPALQYQADWSAFMTGPVAGERQTLRFAAQRLVPPNVSKPECVGVFLRLEVPDGTPLGSQHPYLAVSVAGSDPVAVLPAPDGTAHAMLDRPVAIDPGGAEIVAVFDLRAGYAPASLRTEAGDRLDPAVLRDLEIVPYLAGDT
jgi:hypothetical protein